MSDRPTCETPGCGREIPIGGEGYPEICPTCLRDEATRAGRTPSAAAVPERPAAGARERVLAVIQRQTNWYAQPAWVDAVVAAAAVPERRPAREVVHDALTRGDWSLCKAVGANGGGHSPLCKDLTVVFDRNRTQVRRAAVTHFTYGSIGAGAMACGGPADSADLMTIERGNATCAGCRSVLEADRSPPREAAPADPTVFAVVYSSYADDEVHALYKTRELAEAERSRLNREGKTCMWEVSEWTVNSAPDAAPGGKPGEESK